MTQETDKTVRRFRPRIGISLSFGVSVPLWNTSPPYFKVRSRVYAWCHLPNRDSYGGFGFKLWIVFASFSYAITERVKESK